MSAYQAWEIMMNDSTLMAEFGKIHNFGLKLKKGRLAQCALQLSYASYMISSRTIILIIDDFLFFIFYFYFLLTV